MRVTWQVLVGCIGRFMYVKREEVMGVRVIFNLDLYGESIMIIQAL